MHPVGVGTCMLSPHCMLLAFHRTHMHCITEESGVIALSMCGRLEWVSILVCCVEDGTLSHTAICTKSATETVHGVMRSPDGP